jgi:cobaltochelatase CobT
MVRSRPRKSEIPDFNIFPQVNEQVRRRRLERHCAATIRALSAKPGAEYRKHQLFLGGKAQSPAVPHLWVNMRSDPLDRCRGVADSLAMRLVYCDLELHRKLMPEDPVERLVFEILEQLRVESLAPPVMAGAKNNIERSFVQWCRQSRAAGLTENELGLMVYSITHIVRARLGSVIVDEEVEGVIESVRFRLAPVIGSELAQLGKNRNDQQEYGKLALEIARKLEDITQAEGAENVGRYFTALRSRNLLPPVGAIDDRFSDDPDYGDEFILRSLDKAREYRVYCRDYDSEVNGRDLYRLEQRRELRERLDQMVAAQAISVNRLAQRFLLLFAVRDRAGWHDGEEEGLIDGRRLCQVVSRPGYNRVFKQEKQVPLCDTVLSFLIDNSGSMKRQRFEAVAVLVDIFCRALERAGVNTEVLGFTTGGWTGGESIKQWRHAGSPENPGRLNDRMHIVYKDADTPWRRSRYSIASMLNPLHFREGLDGEALAWAGFRLLNRPEARKCIVMISDGAPMDSASSNYNEKYFLERHLKDVARHIERSGKMELKAIGIGRDMDEFISASINLDLTGTLDNSAFRALEFLFSTSTAVQPGQYNQCQ